VEEAPVVSAPLSPAPVAQISLVARHDAFHEPVAVPVLAPAPPRFLSQDEEDEVKEEGAVEIDKLDKADDANGRNKSDKWDETGFFSASMPSVDSDAVSEPAEEDAAFDPEEMETEAVPALPRFAELSEEPAYTLLPRDYAPTFTSAVRGPVALNDYRAQPVMTLFPKTSEEAQPDLEKPTFLRRLQL
jgi:hypothetical protein